MELTPLKVVMVTGALRGRAEVRVLTTAIDPEVNRVHLRVASLVSKMQAAAAARGRSDRLTFTGLVHDVEHDFRLADVFALPSLREGLPVALMEAMSCGLPCVASRLPGATDTLIDDGVSGVLVPPGDVGAFAAALAAVLADPARASAMGTAARQVVLDRFAGQRVAER